MTSRPSVLYGVKFYARLVRPLGRDVLGVRTQEEAASLVGVEKLPILPCD